MKFIKFKANAEREKISLKSNVDEDSVLSEREKKETKND